MIKHWIPSEEFVKACDEFYRSAQIFETAKDNVVNLRRAVQDEVERNNARYPSHWDTLKNLTFTEPDELDYVHAYLGDLYMGTIKDDGGGIERYLVCPPYLRRPTLNDPAGTLQLTVALCGKRDWELETRVARAVIGDRLRGLFLPYGTRYRDDDETGFRQDGSLIED